MDMTNSQPESNRPWKRLIDELVVDLKRLDDDRSLLGDIDQSILSIPRTGSMKDVARLFVDSTARFSAIHANGPKLLCYVDLGTDLHILDDEAFPGSPRTIRLASTLSPLTEEMEGPSRARVLVPADDETLFSHFPGAIAILLEPLFSSTHDVLCLFLLVAAHKAHESILREADFQTSVLNLCSQLKIAYQHSDAATHYKALEDLWSAFLALKLSPTDCFKELAHDAARFLPSFGPLRLSDPSLKVQILTLARDTNGGPEHLTIRGTMGKEAEGTRIDITKSVCGLLVSDSERPDFYDDPTNPLYRDIYRKYLSAGGANEIRTEFALRLVHDGKLIGIMNLESERPNALHIHHRRALEALARSIAPVVEVLEQRLAMNRAMQETVASSTATYLDGLAGIFDHAVRTPMVALRLGFDQMAKLVSVDADTGSPDAERLSVKPRTHHQDSDAPERPAALVKRLLDVHSSLQRYVEQFVADIKSYHDVGPKDVQAIVGEAIKLVVESVLAPVGGRIRIQWDPASAPNARVNCSTLLKQHLYNLLHNAVQSIQARMRDDPSQGVIAVTIGQEKIPEGQEQELNETWVVTIRDDGTGVSKSDLDKLRRFEPGTRCRTSPGKGYALVAAHRYVGSIGGHMKIDSLEHEWFMVQLFLLSSKSVTPEPRIHGSSRSTSDESGAHHNG